VRPLKLKFRGLRSYRGQLEVDFTDVNLMAIIGDTGAGKSSILEALFFALYGGSSWDKRGGRSLIAAGGDGHLVVELTFRASGRTWQARRTASATGSPPAVHHLTCLDGGPEIDGARAVDEKIREVVGFDANTFLKAVVLPQGRFQELLHTKESDRSVILKSILGLDELASVRELAHTARERIEPRLNAMAEQRASLLAAPHVVLTDTEGKLSRLREQSEALDRIKQTITAAHTAVGVARARAETCQTTGDELAAEIPDDASERYQHLTALDARLTEDLARVDHRIDTAAQREAALLQQVETADANGSGVRGTATALSTIDALLDKLFTIQQEQDDIAAKQGETDTAEYDLVRDENALEELTAAANTAEEQHHAASQQLLRRQKLLADLEPTVHEWSRASEEAKRAANDHKRWTAKLEEAEKTDEQTRQAVEETQVLLAAAERADAVAHAASSCLPGQSCPVCQQTLPEDFIAPSGDGIADAEAAHVTAKDHAKVAAKALRAASARLSAAEVTAGTASDAVKTAGLARKSAREAVLTEFGSHVSTLDDAETLALLRDAIDAEVEATGTRRNAARQARDAAVAEEARLVEARQALDRQRNTLTEREEALDGRRRAAQDAYASLPDMYRRNDPLSMSALADAKLLAEQRDSELRKLIDELGDAQSSLHEVRQERGELEERRTTEVVKPAEKVRAQLIRATARSQEAARLTEESAVPSFPGSSEVADEGRWAADVVAQVGALVAACRTEAATQAEKAQAARDCIMMALHDAGAADESELEKRHRKLVGDIAIEEERRGTALSELPLSTELDRRIAAAQPVVSGLRELHRLLADGKFPAAVVRRRQRALLGAASDLLNSMTGRFSFAADFRVVDNELGLPRDVRTLSGGETFLASLALALGLVELTSRGGARVEALFLDEGFGTLDANALDEALDALARQAGEDRLVAVISHVRSVAANVDDILLVTKNFSGSQARWLTAAERDQIVTAEIDRGLLE
jgi:exonuclease SbcC